MSALQQQQPQQSTSAIEQQSSSSDQQQLQQQQQQYASMMAAQQAQAQMQMQATAPMVESGSGGPPPLSALQQQQLQQLQFQQMQWQYLQQMQMQQHYLQQQQQQQQAQGATFNPADGGVAQSTGASRYRSAYQSYGNYPSDDQQQQQPQQQMVQLDSSGNPLGGTLPPLPDNRLSSEQRGDGLTTQHSGSGSVRARKSHEPSVDPNAWNSSIAYPSKSNPDRYLAHRSFFSDIPPVVKSVLGSSHAALS